MDLRGGKKGNMFDMSSPVYTEVQFALVFELRQQLLLRLPNSHTLSEHSVQKELAGLSKQNNNMLHVHDFRMHLHVRCFVAHLWVIN